MAVNPTKSISSSGGFKPVISSRERPSGTPVSGFDDSPKPTAADCLPANNGLLTGREQHYKSLSASEKVKLYSKLEKCRPQLEAIYGEKLGAKAFEHAVAVYLEMIECTAGDVAVA